MAPRLVKLDEFANFIDLKSNGPIRKQKSTIPRVKSERVTWPTIGAQKSRVSASMPNTGTLKSSLIIFHFVNKLIKGVQVNIFRSSGRRWFAEDVKVRVASERHNSTRTGHNMHPTAVEKRKINQRMG